MRSQLEQGFALPDGMKVEHGRVVDRDDRVAVLYSPGYGAGWGTWNTDRKDCVFCPELVAAVLAEKDRDELERIAESHFPGIYTGGLRDIDVEWIPRGTAFDIDEYDGYETIRSLDTPAWVA